MDKTVALTGATGLLGHHLQPALAKACRCRPICHRSGPDSAGYPFADLSEADATASVLDRLRPDIVIHLVALSDVDSCQNDPSLAHRVTVRSTQNIARWIRRQDRPVRLVYISTDQVYDGQGPHGEEDVAPANVYGLTKLRAEDEVRTLSDHLVMRVNFFALGSPARLGLAGWLIKSFQEERPIVLFEDVLFNPLYVDDLADTMIELLERDAGGTYNLGSGCSGLSKAAFGRRLAERFGLSTASARAGSVVEASLDAYRPNDMRMRVGKAEAVLERKLPSIEAGLERLHAAWLGGAGRVAAH